MRLEATDNLYLSETTGNREMIATIAPNFWLSQQGRLLNLEIDFAYEMYRFLNEPDLNDRVDTPIGTLNGLVLPERDFNVELYGDARLVNVDWRRSDVIDTPTVNTTTRYIGRLRPVYHLELGARHAVETAYVYETVRYSDATSDDTEAQRVELFLTRHQSARLDFRLEGFYEQFDSKNNTNFERLQGLAGGEWRPFTTTTLTAMGGISWFEYETGENFNSRILDCQMLYAPSRRWTIDAAYIENFEYGVEDGLYKTWRGEGGVSYTGRLSWRVGLFFREDDYVEILRDDRERGVVGNIGYQLTPKVALGAYGESRRLKFEPVGERVERINAGVSIEYRPRDYAIFICRYGYRNSDSDIDTHDYIENRASCEVQLTYAMIN